MIGLITSINILDNLKDSSDSFPVQIEKTGTSREPQQKQEIHYSYCSYAEMSPLRTIPTAPYCYSCIDKKLRVVGRMIFSSDRKNYA